MGEYSPAAAAVPLEDASIPTLMPHKGHTSRIVVKLPAQNRGLSSPPSTATGEDADDEEDATNDEHVVNREDAANGEDTANEEDAASGEDTVNVTSHEPKDGEAVKASSGSVGYVGYHFRPAAAAASTLRGDAEIFEPSQAREPQDNSAPYPPLQNALPQNTPPALFCTQQQYTPPHYPPQHYLPQQYFPPYPPQQYQQPYYNVAPAALVAYHQPPRWQRGPVMPGQPMYHPPVPQQFNPGHGFAPYQPPWPVQHGPSQFGIVPYQQAPPCQPAPLVYPQEYLCHSEPRQVGLPLDYIDLGTEDHFKPENFDRLRPETKQWLINQEERKAKQRNYRVVTNLDVNGSLSYQPWLDKLDSLPEEEKELRKKRWEARKKADLCLYCGEAGHKVKGGGCPHERKDGVRYSRQLSAFDRDYSAKQG